MLSCGQIQSGLLAKILPMWLAQGAFISLPDFAPQRIKPVLPIFCVNLYLYSVSASNVGSVSTTHGCWPHLRSPFARRKTCFFRDERHDLAIRRFSETAQKCSSLLDQT